MRVLRLFGASHMRCRRTIAMPVIFLFVALFTLLAPLSQPAWANPGTWGDGVLTFDGETYSPAPSESPQRAGQVAYQWIDTSADPDKAYLIYFSSEGDVEAKDTATRISYDYDDGNYSNPSSEESVSINNSLDAVADEDGVINTCVGSHGVGWFICPVSYYIAEGTDRMYGLVQDFLEVPTASINQDSGLYQLWSFIRSIANVCFVIAFLVIIYSQITSIGISNYSIKTMLPRLIIGAILVNVSFWISALGIDVSNVIGISVYALFDNVRDNMDAAVDVDWSGLTAFILSGGAVVGSLGFIAATGGSFMGLGFLLISVLASVVFGIFVAFVILAARQALITVLLLLSPLAFVAYVLPGTNNLFDRWRKSFMTLLMFFPLFALLFGGSAVASAAIINNADGILHIVLIGLAVQVVPLVITPFLIQFSSGILGRIAGMASSRHGLIDRTKNWARENAEQHKDRALGQTTTVNPFKLTARAMNRRKITQNQRRAGYKSNAEHMARERYNSSTGKWESRRQWEQADRFKRQTEGDLNVAEERSKARFTELQAGHNTYQDPRFDVRATAARALNPTLSKATGGKSQIKTRAQVNTEALVQPASRLAEETAIAGLRNTEASRTVSEQVNAHILANTELQARATGVAGNRDIMLAGLVAKERDDYGKKVNAQDQLMRHFALNSSEYQNLAVGKGNVVKTKVDAHGNVTAEYKFVADNEYTREAAIEMQLAAGSAGQKREIINEAGREVVEVTSDGTIKMPRAGKNYDFRTTIKDAIVKNNVGNALPFLNDKSLDQLVRGEWRGDISEYSNSIREILEARFKADNLSTANDNALSIIYGLQDLRNGSPQDQALFEHFKSDALDVIKNSSSKADYEKYRDNFDAIFDKNYLDAQHQAWKILDDAELSSRASKASREVFERYSVKPPDPT